LLVGDEAEQVDDRPVRVVAVGRVEPVEGGVELVAGGDHGRGGAAGAGVHYQLPPVSRHVGWAVCPSSMMVIG
jgi:hypothetical protein